MAINSRHVEDELYVPYCQGEFPMERNITLNLGGKLFMMRFLRHYEPDPVSKFY